MFGPSHAMTTRLVRFWKSVATLFDLSPRIQISKRCCSGTQMLLMYGAAFVMLLNITSFAQNSTYDKSFVLTENFVDDKKNTIKIVEVSFDRENKTFQYLSLSSNVTEQGSGSDIKKIQSAFDIANILTPTSEMAFSTEKGGWVVMKRVLSEALPPRDILMELVPETNSRFVEIRNQLTNAIRLYHLKNDFASATQAAMLLKATSGETNNVRVSEEGLDFDATISKDGFIEAMSVRRNGQIVYQSKLELGEVSSLRFSSSNVLQVFEGLGSLEENAQVTKDILRQKGKFGLGIFDHKGKVYIDYVAEKSQAAEAGIEVGDQVLAVNGKEVYSTTDILSAIASDIDVELSLLRRAEKTFRVKLQKAVRP